MADFIKLSHKNPVSQNGFHVINLNNVIDMIYVVEQLELGKNQYEEIISVKANRFILINTINGNELVVNEGEEPDAFNTLLKYMTSV